MKRKDRALAARRRLVSDHAIVRYIERVLGSPELIEQIVNDILDDGRDAIVQGLPGPVYVRVGGRMQLTIAQGRVVTVLGAEKQK